MGDGVICPFKRKMIFAGIEAICRERRILATADVGDAGIVSRQHRDLVTGQLTRNASHLLTNVVTPIPSLKDCICSSR